MAKVAIRVNCILNWSNEYARMLVLQTLDKQTSFPVIIAGSEAVSLLKELEKVAVKRPQTHDLFFSVLQAFNIKIREIYIHKLVEGIFYTKLICRQDEHIIELDARPSDAIILAIKAGASMFVEDDILEKLGVATSEMEKQIVSPQEYNEQFEENTDVTYEEMSDDELQTMLNMAVEAEDFETASRIRDILKQRKDM
ncbi:MAG: bifunctional nuclease family protein [Bacteroidales bacterium]|jgi:bifunctional DNase/RNase|nr:bifunctional nuclease family protein [Bacteroidales bacterium]